MSDHQRCRADLDAITEWLYKTGYPFDWSSDVVPPFCLWDRLERIWPDKDEVFEEEERDGYKRNVAEQGGWVGRVTLAEQDTARWRHAAMGLSGDYRVTPEEHAKDDCPLCVGRE